MIPLAKDSILKIQEDILQYGKQISQKNSKESLEISHQYSDESSQSEKSKEESKTFVSKEKPKHKLQNNSINLKDKSERCISMLQKMIKHRVSERISNIQNRILYPILMGPHPLYTSDSGYEERRKIKSVELVDSLKQWVKKQMNIRLKNSSLIKFQKVEESQSQQNETKNQKGGVKYKKYSLQFKKNIVKKINQQFEKQQRTSKSLRFYIMKQANQLNIHPKNINRWMHTDLDLKQGGRRARYPLFEYKLANFIKINPQCKRKEILQQAKKIMKEMGEGQDFNFSKGWYQRFRNRLKKQKVSRSVGWIKSQLIQNRQQIKIFHQKGLQKSGFKSSLQAIQQQQFYTHRFNREQVQLDQNFKKNL